MAPRPDVSTERRAQIIEAALTCFTRKGYVNTTMDDIVAESGLSKGAIYWYFKSKDDLFEAAANSVLERVAEKSLTAIQACETSTERLRVGAQSMVEVCREIEGYFGLVIEFWTQNERGEKAISFWAEMIAQYRRGIKAIFDMGVRTGEFKPVDTDALAWMIMAAYDGLAAYHMMMPDIDVDKTSEGFIEALLKGLEADGEPE
ncbi:MAG: TetR/AcrR family transcriptional regulator [Anaerolineae bacterium]|nr:TetR/AcrR family transcriptional regulator [Anaerolineae bacterium]